MAAHQQQEKKLVCVDVFNMALARMDKLVKKLMSNPVI
jgi:hypothetical protein